MNVAPRPHYQRNLYDSLADRCTLEKLKPESLRKLVEGAVQYAHDLGLPPHHDYRAARQIFGNISAESCAEEFEYGKDGKPCFIPGPFDDMNKCIYIGNVLREHCGEDNFEIVLNLNNLMKANDFLD